MPGAAPWNSPPTPAGACAASASACCASAAGSCPTPAASPLSSPRPPQTFGAPFGLASSASPGRVPEASLRPRHCVASISASIRGGRARLPAARINRAANADAEPPHAINGRRALQDSASRRHWLPACHLTQPDTALTRPSVNTAGVPLHRGFDRLLAAVRRQNSVLLQGLDVLTQHDQPVKITVQRYWCCGRQCSPYRTAENLS